MEFSTQIQVRWSDVDHNQHVRHSAYYDYGAHARIQFFKAHGFDMASLAQLGIGPILFTEQCAFIKELRLNETITINVKIGAIRPDGSRWEMYHELFNAHGDKAAQIKVTGAWMDMKKRRLTTPPAALVEAISKLPEGTDYTYQKSS